MKKGLTQVVTVALLLTISLAAAGTVYTLYQQTEMDSTNEAVTNIPVSDLKVEACGNQETDAVLNVRNKGEESINITRVSVRIDGKTRETTTESGELSGGSTGSIIVKNTYLSSSSSGKLVNDDREKNFSCNIDEETPPAPTDEDIPSPGF